MSTKQTPNTCAPGSQSRRSLLGIATGGGVVVLLAGCSIPARGTAVPIGQTTQASVLGVPNERFFPFYGTEPLEVEFAAAADRLRQAQGLAATAPLPEVQLLAVSGGGENGAFGAGLLCGWSEHGTRPVFGLVTGVSTGALTAPFAYLGSGCDPQLRAVYTELTEPMFTDFSAVNLGIPKNTEVPFYTENAADAFGYTANPTRPELYRPGRRRDSRHVDQSRLGEVGAAVHRHVPGRDTAQCREAATQCVY